MKKFVILGCENSHADQYLKQMANGGFPDLECVGVYSNEPEAMTRLNEQFGVPTMERFDEAVGQVDGVIITARDGIHHYEYAKPYLASGVPMFIDKPITCDPAEAVEFMKDCRQNGVRLCGGSTVILWPNAVQLQEFAAERRDKILAGTVSAPLHIDSEHSGFWFYAQHLVQLVTSIFGAPQSLTARRDGMRVSILFHYEGYEVSGLYHETNSYHADVITKAESLALNIPADKSAYGTELEKLVRLMDGAEPEMTYEELIEPVFIMDAIIKSYTEERSVEVEYLCLD